MKSIFMTFFQSSKASAETGANRDVSENHSIIITRTTVSRRQG